MPSLYTETEINASKKQVWQALYHKERWLKWNSFLFDANSSLTFTEGQEIFLSLRRVPGEEKTEYQALVTLVQPGFCLSWVSSIIGFRTECIFELQEIGVGRTKYIHREIFSGWLTRLFFPFIRSDEHRGMERMARELKRYVEGR